MKYSVLFYCPDKHLVYDGRLPDTKGVGGGVTARIRLATALAARGHQVTLVCNCPNHEIYRGVEYIPLGEARSLRADILIFTTSGDGLDLTPVFQLDIQAKLRILWVHGLPYPRGTAEISPDYFYVPGSFIRNHIRSNWHIPAGKIFTSHHGINKSYFERNLFETVLKPRNPYRLCYAGNPLKGLNAAIEILRILRKKNKKFHLNVYGDERLWGAQASALRAEKGVRFLGTVSQKQLPKELLTCNFALHLQSIPEAFGITLVEAKYAGCIVLASPVGAYPELIQDERNGVIVRGDFNAPETWAVVADKIFALMSDEKKLNQIRQSARIGILDWLDVAQTCEEHWDCVLDTNTATNFNNSMLCPECKSETSLRLHDGYHCSSCGNYWT